MKTNSLFSRQLVEIKGWRLITRCKKTWGIQKWGQSTSPIITDPKRLSKLPIQNNAIERENFPFLSILAVLIHRKDYLSFIHVYVIINRKILNIPLPESHPNTHLALVRIYWNKYDVHCHPPGLYQFRKIKRCPHCRGSLSDFVSGALIRYQRVTPLLLTILPYIFQRLTLSLDVTGDCSYFLEYHLLAVLTLI